MSYKPTVERSDRGLSRDSIGRRGRRSFWAGGRDTNLYWLLEQLPEGKFDHGILSPQQALPGLPTAVGCVDERPLCLRGGNGVGLNLANSFCNVGDALRERKITKFQSKPIFPRFRRPRFRILRPRDTRDPAQIDSPSW